MYGVIDVRTFVVEVIHDHIRVIEKRVRQQEHFLARFFEVLKHWEESRVLDNVLRWVLSDLGGLEPGSWSRLELGLGRG